MKNDEILSRGQIALAVFLIGVLWWGASYKLEYLREQAHKTMTEKNLRRISDAIVVYRGDNQGACPARLEDLLKDNLDKIPPAYHKGVKSARVKNGAYIDLPGDTGGWFYDNAPSDKEYCKVFVNTI